MDLITPHTVIPLQWIRYKNYRIDTIENYLLAVDPEEIETNLRALKESLYEKAMSKHRDPQDPFDWDSQWETIKNMRVIFPAVDASADTYDVWQEPQRSERFKDFSSLTKPSGPPADHEVIAWAEKYGLPCKDATSASLALCAHCVAEPIMRYLRNLEVATSLQLATDSAWKEVSQKRIKYGSRDAMLLDLFIDLSKEAYETDYWFKSLKTGKMPELEPHVRSAILKNDGKKGKHIKAQDIPIEMWEAVKERVRIRFRGVTLTTKIKKIDKHPFIELQYAYEAIDLLAAMWLCFFDEMLKIAPYELCECGKSYEQKHPNQKYCKTECQNKYNQQKFRDKKRQQALASQVGAPTE